MPNKDNPYLKNLFEHPLYRIVISMPAKQDADIKKISCRQLENNWQCEIFDYDNKVFHKNLNSEELYRFVEEKFTEDFKRINAWDENAEYMLERAKNSKLRRKTVKLSSTAPAKIKAHNREKQYLLPEGNKIPVLEDMGIFTKEGKTVKSKYKKYRQINRFLEILDDKLKKAADDPNNKLKIIDYGCGKSYLSFLTYHYFAIVKGMNIEMIGLDLKKDVVAKANRAAAKYNYENLRFEVGDIAGYKGEADVVISLHACDTATDYALFNAVKTGARYIFSVPCCQHELNAQIECDSPICDYGITKERFAALLTDSFRADLLKCCGYDCDLMEFIDLAHTPKNILIRAEKAYISPEQRAKKLERLQNIAKQYKIYPCLLKLFEEDKYFE